jgi:hypothetical protein
VGTKNKEESSLVEWNSLCLHKSVFDIVVVFIIMI